MKWLLAHKRFLILSGLALGFIVSGVLVTSYYYVGSYKKYVLTGDISASIRKNGGPGQIGIVFGSGITKDGKPYKELQGRLDTAADALNRGDVWSLVLTGDNRFKNYDEPTAMKNYLVDVRHVNPDHLQLDFAGRSTYESCERASKIFEIPQAILFSAPSHLPRAIFTCRKFGIKAYGVPAGGDANNATRREFLARTKAVFNIYIKGENTILGDPIPMVKGL